MKKNKKIPNLGNEKRRLPIWEMQKTHTKKNKMQKKNLLKNAQNMTNLVKKEPNNLLAKWRFWTSQVGSGSSHRADDKKIAKKWQENDSRKQEWQKNTKPNKKWWIDAKNKYSTTLRFCR